MQIILRKPSWSILLLPRLSNLVKVFFEIEVRYDTLCYTETEIRNKDVFNFIVYYTEKSGKVSKTTSKQCLCF